MLRNERGSRPYDVRVDNSGELYSAREGLSFFFFFPRRNPVPLPVTVVGSRPSSLWLFAPRVGSTMEGER